jgi:hypothetical protein
MPPRRNPKRSRHHQIVIIQLQRHHRHPPDAYNITAELEYLDRVWPINRDILLQYQQEQKNDGSIQITSSKIANGDYRRLVV